VVVVAVDVGKVTSARKVMRSLKASKQQAATEPSCFFPSCYSRRGDWPSGSGHEDAPAGELCQPDLAVATLS
jgi:hypothetical protein